MPRWRQAWISGPCCASLRVSGSDRSPNPTNSGGSGSPSSCGRRPCTTTVLCRSCAAASTSPPGFSPGSCAAGSATAAYWRGRPAEHRQDLRGHLAGTGAAAGAELRTRRCRLHRRGHRPDWRDHPARDPPSPAIRPLNLYAVARRSTCSRSCGPNQGGDPPAALSASRPGWEVAVRETCTRGSLRPHLIRACAQVVTPKGRSGASSAGLGGRRMSWPSPSGRISRTPRPRSAASGKIVRSTSRCAGL